MAVSVDAKECPSVQSHPQRNWPALVRSFVTHPAANLSVMHLGTRARLAGASYRPLVFSTHHKALTVLFGRMLKTFARISGEDFSEGNGSEINWGAGLILDHHSRVDRENLPGYRGVHVTRDPRDVLVSCAHYHKKSSEGWLHVAYDEFGGQTYQQTIQALPDFEAVLLFELDHVAGKMITDMLAWERGRPHTAEVAYEALLAEGAADYLSVKLMDAGFDALECRLLVRLFKNFSIGGPWMAKYHVRNPNPGQHHIHFKGAVREKFETLFPDALARLGYE